MRIYSIAWNNFKTWKKITHNISSDDERSATNWPQLYHSSLGSNCCSWVCFSPPLGWRLLSCSDSTHRIPGAQHMLIERMTKPTWPAFLEELGKLKIWGVSGCDYLAHLVSQFSTFPSTYSLFSFISSFALLLSWLFKVWNSSMMRSASDSAFRNVFSCFQRGLLQRGALLFKGGSYTVLGFLHPIKGTNPPARGFSVLRKLQSSIGTNQGNKRFNVSLVLVTAWEDSVITSQHTYTQDHIHVCLLEWSNDPSAFLQLMCSTEVWGSSTGVQG